MPKYVKIMDGKIVKELNTNTEIDKSACDLKGLKRLVHVRPNVPEGTKPERADAYYFFDDRVELVTNNFVHIETLEEAKNRKIRQLKEFLEPYFPPLFKQINTLFGLYDEGKSKNIKDKIIKYKALIDAKEVVVNNCSTIAEVDDVKILLEEV